MKTRDEHLQWCKERALEYLPGDPMNAMNSMMSDLAKHPGLHDHIGLRIAPLFYGLHHDPQAVRRWIEGFN